MASTINTNTVLNGGYSTNPGTASTVTLTGTSSWLANSSITGTISAPNANFHNGSGKPLMTIPHGEDKVVVEPQAELEVKGRVRINGEYLDERLERIETLLNIPTRDIIMEHKYPKLKELWEAYNRELAKYKTWDKLKDSE